jgi:hypothetical protein
MNGSIGPWIVAIAVIVGAMLWTGRFTARIAVRRGQSKWVWFVVGALLFPLFPIPQFVVELLPRR